MFPNSFLFRIQMPLMSPPDLPNVTSVSGVSESDAVDQLFGDGDEDEDTKTEETETDAVDDDEDSETEDASDEDAENEETVDKEETEDEEDTEVASYGPVSKKELLGKYPKLFKDFPGLGNTFAREQKFTELFPTIEEAEEANSLAVEYKGFADKIMNGDANFLLGQIKGINKKSFLKLTDNFLEAVQEIDRDHFNTLLEPYIKRVIRHAFAAGTNVGNENLINSAQHISKFLFGNPNVEQLEIKAKRNKSNDNEDDDSELSQREKELNSRQERFFQQQFTEKAQAVGDSIDTELGSDLDKSVDPHGKMSDYFKRNLKRDIINGVHEQLKSEPALSRTMQTLWNKARAAGYPNAMLNKIRSTYIQRAKQVLPAVKARIKAEAFKTGKSVPGTKKPNSSTSRNIPAGRSLSGGGNGAGKKMPDPKAIDFRRTSDRDILDGNYTPRK